MLVDAVKVDTTRDALVKEKDSTLEMVKIVAWLVETLVRSPLDGLRTL